MADSTHELVSALLAARTKDDVRLLQQRHDTTTLQAAWRSLPLLDRQALLLARSFDGEIFHELSCADFGLADPA